jgi:exonuclease SbcC
MILKSIHLNNIRSYVDEKINFDDGIVVLSGDIGSGKSTVLLAVEFALFGVHDSGASLLRKGTDEGFVELNFVLDNKDIVIKRVLKQKSEGIRQLHGHIIVNNTKKDLMPIELKQTIISLLGYPQESLTKKSLMYRYTTYTPQDEMKQILYGGADERIGTIRKIFGIDRYQRILENTVTLSRQLREQKRELTGYAMDLEQKKQEQAQVLAEKEKQLNQQADVAQRLQQAQQQVLLHKKDIMQLEEELKKVTELKKEKALLAASIKHTEERIVSLQKEIERVKEDSAVLRGKTTPEIILVLKEKIKTTVKDEIMQLEKEHMQLHKQIGELDAVKKASQKVQEQIADLHNCPLCLQTVPHEHKEGIKNKEQEKTKTTEESLQQIHKKIDELKQKITAKNKELAESDAAEKELSIAALYLKQLSETESRLQEKTGQMNEQMLAVKTLQEKNNMLQLPNTEEKELQHQQSKKQLDETQQKERLIELEYTRLTTEIKNSEKLFASLAEEIAKKTKAKEKQQELSVLEHWLENNFTKIIQLIEKHILSSIYGAFNDFFRELFEILIDDERLVVRIDESFTPCIEQNGHEIEFENLSGGEKTSVCLAYRLALHKSINIIMSQIQTRGLLLLDEPTDGFSSEQIDKLRDVFDKLQAQQTIIVSHENKIESIADHVVKIVKKGHQSLVLV